MVWIIVHTVPGGRNSGALAVKLFQQGFNLHPPDQSVFSKGQPLLLLLISRTQGSYLCPRLGMNWISLLTLEKIKLTTKDDKGSGPFIGLPLYTQPSYGRSLADINGNMAMQGRKKNDLWPLPSTILRLVVAVQLLSRVWLCNPMDCSMPGFPVLHYLPEIAQR